MARQTAFLITLFQCVKHGFPKNLEETWESEGGGGDLHEKMWEMLVILIRGVFQGVWPHLAYSRQNATDFSSQSIFEGST